MQASLQPYPPPAFRVSAAKVLPGSANTGNGAPCFTSKKRDAQVSGLTTTKKRIPSRIHDVTVRCIDPLL